MLVDIAQIPAEGLDLHFRGGKDFLDPAGERVHLLRPAEARLHFSRTPIGVWVRGQVSSDLQLHCSRCSELFTFPVCEDFEVRYHGPLGESVEGEYELGRDELDVSFFEGMKIDVEALVRENLLLALPAQPLCDEGCLGLCSCCGINRNRGACVCFPAGLDPRWSKLKSLL